MFYRLRSGASVFLLTLVALLTFGCGDSHEFVATGTGGGGPGLVNGSELVFRFERPVAAQTEVPVTTASVRFDLFSTQTASEDSLISTETRPYRDVIVIDDVSPATRSVRVVLLDANGVPLGFYTVAVEVPPNTRVEVTLSQADFVPATMTEFSLGPNPLEFFVAVGDKASSRAQLVATATINGAAYEVPIQDVALTAEHGNIVDVLNDGWLAVKTPIFVLLGIVEGGESDMLDLLPGRTTVTGTYTLQGVTKQAVVPVSIHRMASLAGVAALMAEQTGYGFLPVYPDEFIPLYFYNPDDETDETRYGAYYLNPDNQVTLIPFEDLTYRLESPSDKITLHSEEGYLAIEESAPLGTEFHLEVTWVDDRSGGSNHTYVERATFQVSDDDFPIVWF